MRREEEIKCLQFKAQPLPRGHMEFTFLILFQYYILNLSDICPGEEKTFFKEKLHNHTLNRITTDAIYECHRSNMTAIHFW